MEWNGKKIPAEQINMSISFESDSTFAVKRGDKVGSERDLSSTKSQKTFDATVAEGEGKGSVMLGIYKLDGDTICVCMNVTGRERPGDFKATTCSESDLGPERAFTNEAGLQ